MSKKVFTSLISWSESQYSHLPWRMERSLYRTLVSEIMLQQTTVGTVLNHFEKFINEYPDIFTLAKSSEEQICISWKGLGYYRRARNLRNIAIQIVDQHQGKIPIKLDQLLSLKGIGPYTANAIVSIGANELALAVDANLERVLSRFYSIKLPKGIKLQQQLLKDFEEEKILAETNQLSSRKLNEAFMDLGRIICQSKKASCLICPLKPECVSSIKGDPLSLPLGNEKKKSGEFYIKLLRVVVKDENKILFYQKKSNEWLAGQWELPTFILETNDEKLEQYPKIKSKKYFLDSLKIKTSITKYSIENYIVEMDTSEFRNLTKKVERLYEFKAHTKKLNLSTASIKVLKKIE